MKIKFKNDTELDYLKAIETEEYFNGSSRRTLTFECDTNAISIDELNDILSVEDNLKEITLIGEPYPVYKKNKITTQGVNETGEEINIEQEVITDEIERYETSQNIYNGYILKLKCGVESVMTESESSETPAKYEDKIIFKLGKRTYVEEQLNKLGL